MGTVVESQILRETEKCHILHFKTDKEWHRRSALLETVLNNREIQMKTMPGASSVLPISISILSGPNIPSVSHFIPFLNPPFFLVIILPQAWHLISFPASSACQPLTSSRGSTELSVHLAQQPHCLPSPLFPLQGTFSQILVWQAPFCPQILAQVPMPQKT